MVVHALISAAYAAVTVPMMMTVNKTALPISEVLCMRSSFWGGVGPCAPRVGRRCHGRSCKADLCRNRTTPAPALDRKNTGIQLTSRHLGNAYLPKIWGLDDSIAGKSS